MGNIAYVPLPAKSCGIFAIRLSTPPAVKQSTILHISIVERNVTIVSKNDNIELNAYGERIAPKKQVKNNNFVKKSAKNPKKSEPAKKSEPKKSDIFAKKAPAKPVKKPAPQNKKPQKNDAPMIHPETGKPLHTTNHRPAKKTPLKIIPLGGLNEIGKNMTVFECANDIFIVEIGRAHV